MNRPPREIRTIPRVWVVLPAFNEAGNIERLVPSLDRVMRSLGRHYRCIVVDDGSTDRTLTILGDLAKQFPLEVRTHPVNLGLGSTLRSGIKAALEAASDADAIVVMDADNTHPPESIAVMLRWIEDHIDVVIASRYRSGAQVHGLSASRKALSLGAAVLFKAALPMKNVRDYTCGYRAYHAGTLRRAFSSFDDALSTTSGFEASAELLLQLRSIGARAREVPLTLHYDRREGVSKMRVGKTVFDTLGLLVKRRRK